MHHIVITLFDEIKYAINISERYFIKNPNGSIAKRTVDDR